MYRKDMIGQDDFRSSHPKGDTHTMKKLMTLMIGCRFRVRHDRRFRPGAQEGRHQEGSQEGQGGKKKEGDKKEGEKK